MTSPRPALYIHAMLRTLRYALEGALICFAIVFFRLLPLDAASALGGLLARLAGPLSRAHRTARDNLKQALPELSEERRQRILSGMWDNLGRVIGEYPHLTRPVMAKRITIEGREHMERVRRSGKGAIFVSGHFANWEIIPLAAALCDLPVVVIYREANNPIAEAFIRWLRGHYTHSMHSKSRLGAVQSLRALKEGHPLAMLIDQKQNDGSAVPFFGRDAMTSTTAVQIAAKWDMPLLAARAVRTEGAHFHVTLNPETHYDAATDPIKAMTDINLLFEQWIREYPAQWLWVHRRWK